MVSLCAAPKREACQDQGVSEATRSSVEGANVGDSKETGLRGDRERARSYRTLWPIVLTPAFILIVMGAFGGF